MVLLVLVCHSSPHQSPHVCVCARCRRDDAPAAVSAYVAEYERRNWPLSRYYQDGYDGDWDPVSVNLSYADSIAQNADTSYALLKKDMDRLPQHLRNPYVIHATVLDLDPVLQLSADPRNPASIGISFSAPLRDTYDSPAMWERCGMAVPPELLTPAPQPPALPWCQEEQDSLALAAEQQGAAGEGPASPDSSQ